MKTGKATQMLKNFVRFITLACIRTMKISENLIFLRLAKHKFSQNMHLIKNTTQIYLHIASISCFPPQPKHYFIDCFAQTKIAVKCSNSCISKYQAQSNQQIKCTMPILMYQFDQNIKSSLQIQIWKMSYQNENFGMMDEGYFVPRTQILAWLNNLLNLNLTKIEQLGSGAVYCQVVDVIHPGKVAISKLNWKAKNDYEFINNLKVLQGAFDKIGIKRHVQVEKLAKAKYQDNLEFIQWLKRYYDLNCGQRGNNYKPEERRGNVVIDFSFAEKNVVPKTYNGSGAVVKSQAFQKKKAPTKVEEAPPRKTATVTSTRPTMKKQQKTLSSGTNTSLQAKVQKQSIDISAIQNEYEQKISSMEGDLQRLKRQIGDESERSKQSALRIDMIREILRTEDEAEMKVTLIQELLKEQ